MPDQPDTQVFRAVNPGPLPDNDIDIAFASVSQLSAWLASGSMTSVRLTELYLDRIQTLGPILRCFATVTPELALAQAEANVSSLRGGLSPK